MNRNEQTSTRNPKASHDETRRGEPWLLRVPARKDWITALIIYRWNSFLQYRTSHLEATLVSPENTPNGQVLSRQSAGMPSDLGRGYPPPPPVYILYRYCNPKRGHEQGKVRASSQHLRASSQHLRTNRPSLSADFRTLRKGSHVENWPEAFQPKRYTLPSWAAIAPDCFTAESAEFLSS